MRCASLMSCIAYCAREFRQSLFWHVSPNAGLHSMTSDSAQVRALLAALAARIEASPQCFLSGQQIAGALRA
jgi:hypothetical protein